MSIEARRHQLYALHRPLAHTVFAPDGTIHPETDHRTAIDAKDPRVRIWHTYALFAGDASDRRLANAILRQTTLKPGYDFGMVALLNVWHVLGEHLESDVRELVRACLQKSGRIQMETDSGFVGMNDNFGAMATSIAILCGEFNHDPEPVAWGIGKLRNLVDRLDRDDTISEFNSPTYIPITMSCMAQIVNHAKSPEACDLALRIEQQCWLHVVAAFHPGVGVQGGPSSRSYMVDSCGHLGNLLATLYLQYGEEAVPLNPARQGFGQEPRWTVHHANESYQSASVC